MLYVVRHGQTDWNKDKVMQGQTDIPLNDLGISQAQMTGLKFKSIKFDVVYCSPLIRARQTLDNLKANSKKILYDNRLMERNYGEFEKKPKSSFDYNEFWNYTLNKKYKKAESCKEFFNRVTDLLKEIEIKHKGKNVLLVAHAGTTKVCKCYFDGFLKDEEIGPYLPSNAEVLIYNI